MKNPGLDEIENPICTMCHGPGMPLGTLGSLTWFRCCNCGIEFNSETLIDLDDVMGDYSEGWDA